MTYIWQIMQLLAGLLALLKLFKNYQDNKRIAGEASKSEGRNKAIEDLKKAETLEEIDHALDGIVSNKP